MIRCQECGFSNEPDTKVCKKCGSRIDGASASEPSAPSAPKANAGGGNPTMIGGASNAPSWDGGGTPPASSGGGSSGGGRLSNPTMVGGRSNMPAWDESSNAPSAPAGGGYNPPASASGASAPTGNVAKCPSCGFYPLRSEVSASHPCPNCGNTGSSEAAPEAKAAPAAPAAPQQPSAGHQMQKGAGANKTMRLGDLTPAEEEKPEFKLVDERNQSTKEFTGAEVAVNRDNLDAGNMSISGQEHAKFAFEDGKWYLTDHSSNGATFIQVKGKIELEEDAKILIGNKIYTFKTK